MVIGLLLWGWCALLAGQALAVEPSHAAEVEYEVKAAFIHNFTKFIDWPGDTFETEDSPIRIGILGQGPINGPLMKLNGKEVRKRSLEVTSVNKIPSINEYHIIFINSSGKRRVRAILHTLKGSGILTIGDTSGFAEQCGVINFYLKSGKVRFEVNIEASQRENLKISSRLLRLARIVDTPCN
jgi:hypothetical protein